VKISPNYRKFCLNLLPPKPNLQILQQRKNLRKNSEDEMLVSEPKKTRKQHLWCVLDFLRLTCGHLNVLKGYSTFNIKDELGLVFKYLISIMEIVLENSNVQGEIFLSDWINTICIRLSLSSPFSRDNCQKKKILLLLLWIKWTF
jgi:hypothetical protein